LRDLIAPRRRSSHIAGVQHGSAGFACRVVSFLK